MKRITESELHKEYMLQSQSKAAWVTFGTGLAGAILCVIVFYMTDQYLGEMKRKVDYVEANKFKLTTDEVLAIQKENEERTIELASYGVPLFLSANVCWIIGGFAWSFDLKRNPSNKLIWKLGGLMVLVTAIACGIAWFLLIRLNYQMN